MLVAPNKNQALPTFSKDRRQLRATKVQPRNVVWSVLLPFDHKIFTPIGTGPEREAKTPGKPPGDR
jgi:hypothetical protein